MDSRFTHPTAEQYGATISDGEIAAQTGKLADGTPGAGNSPAPPLGPPADAGPPAGH
jgi:hypothetical protein